MTQYDIANELLQDQYANWSRAGAFALAEYFEQLEEDLGETIEFDAVAIRCEFSEHKSFKDWITEYYNESFDDAIKSAGIDLEGNEDEYEINELIGSHIQNHGQLIEFNGGIIVSQF